MPYRAAGQLLTKYSQNPAGITAVRTATELLDRPAEFVLLEEERAVVIAAIGPTALQPRAITGAELAVLGGQDLAQTQGRTAARVNLENDRIGALCILGNVAGDDEQAVRTLAANLSESICQERSPESISATMAQRLLAGMRDTVMVLTNDFTISWTNDAIMGLLGRTPTDLIGSPAVDLVHPDDLATTIDAAARLQSAEQVHRIHVRMKDALGGWVPVSISGVDQTADPDIGGLVLSIRNDELGQQAERTLEATRRVHSTILQSLSEAVVATNEHGEIEVVNRAARDLFSLDSQALASTLEYGDFRLLDPDGNVVGLHEHPLNSATYWQESEFRIASPTGIRHVTVNRSEVSSNFDHFGVVVTFHDITRARSDARELRNRARHDQLTGLANRRYLQERLRLLDQSDEDVSVAALFVDIDRFKNVNDVHGHNVGDGVLRATAARLRRQIRSIDILARPGGDEFLVVLVNPESASVAIDVADRIRTSLARPFEVDGTRLHLTASVGVALCEGPFDDERIMQQADIALYAAKERGRDRVEIFDQTLATLVEVEQRQRALVQNALDNDGLVMHYQAIVDHNERVLGVEALARCRDDHGHWVGPGAFLDAIADTSLMMRLDMQGFAQSCALAARLAQEPHSRRMFVAANFSAMTIAQPDFVTMIADTITRSGAPWESLCIEVTENAAFQAGTASIEALTELHNRGIRIALDDFGTGYSSLSHLRDLPLSSVKIDRSFTAALSQPGVERAIASAVKDLAWTLGLSVVAEGVETAADRQAVFELGVGTMQGWYFAEALRADELIISLKEPVLQLVH